MRSTEYSLKDLLHACVTGNSRSISSIINYFRRHGKDPANIPFDLALYGGHDFNGCPPLWVAVYNGHFDAAKTLMDFGARPAVPGSYGTSTLTVAAEKNRDDLVGLLVEKLMEHPVADYWFEHCKTALSENPRYGRYLKDLELERDRRNSGKVIAASDVAEAEIAKQQKREEELIRQEALEAERRIEELRLAEERAAEEARRIEEERRRQEELRIQREREERQRQIQLQKEQEEARQREAERRAAKERELEERQRREAEAFAAEVEAQRRDEATRRTEQAARISRAFAREEIVTATAEATAGEPDRAGTPGTSVVPIHTGPYAGWRVEFVERILRIQSTGQRGQYVPIGGRDDKYDTPPRGRY